MKYWSDIKEKLSANIELASQLLLLTLGVYSFILAEDDRLWKVPVLFIGLMTWFFFRDKTKHPIIWILFFIILLVELFQSYFWLANHHFLIVFMVLSLIFYSYHKREDFLFKNIQILLVVVIVSSAFQKLMSSQFTSGEFYYYMFNRGGLFRFFLNFSSESLEVFKSNSESILILQDKDPNHNESIVLKDIVPNLHLISLIFAWVTIVFESIVAIAILWKPKQTWTHLLLLVMILGILCTRFETGFMALLGICGLLLCGNLKLRLLYVTIVLGCVTLMITKLGFH